MQGASLSEKLGHLRETSGLVDYKFFLHAFEWPRACYLGRTLGRTRRGGAYLSTCATPATPGPAKPAGAWSNW